MTKKLRVLLTGATGYLASQLLPTFRERYALRLLDVKETDPYGRTVSNIVLADLSDLDRSTYARVFSDIDVVVHLAYKHPGGSEWGQGLEPFDRVDGEFLNLRMAQNVYRCAYASGIRRVVMASSNHAADWYEHYLIHNRKREFVYPTDLPLSDNFYGWAKASYELLGFVYACGSLGRSLEVVQIRVGAPRDISARNYEDGTGERHAAFDNSAITNFKRDLGAYISAGDLCQLFQRAVDAPNVRNEHGVPWLVVYGISNNTRAFWSLANARQVLGYEPVDDSEVKYADDIRRLLTGPSATAPGGRLGGEPQSG